MKTDEQSFINGVDDTQNKKGEIDERSTLKPIVETLDIKDLTWFSY